MTHQVALKYTQGRISPGHQHILAFLWCCLCHCIMHPHLLRVRLYSTELQDMTLMTKLNAGDMVVSEAEYIPNVLELCTIVTDHWEMVKTKVNLIQSLWIKNCSGGVTFLYDDMRDEHENEPPVVFKLSELICSYATRLGHKRIRK